MPVGISGLACADATSTAGTCFDLHGRGDTDGDEVPNFADNCVVVRNGPNENFDQLDSDFDGFGNACDADYDQDDSVSVADFGPWLACFQNTLGHPLDPDCTRSDFDGDGDVTTADFVVFLAQFQGAPLGPSGLRCADGTIGAATSPNDPICVQ